MVILLWLNNRSHQRAECGRFTLAGRRNPSPEGENQLEWFWQANGPRSSLALVTGLENVPALAQRAALISARLILIFASAVTLHGLSCRASDSVAARVIVLTNSTEAESVQLGHYYAEQRGIPDENVLSFPMSGHETIAWPEFISTVWQPVQDELVRRHWIDAVASSLTDEFGRKRYAISGHRVTYIVTCRGVPLRIGHQSAFLPDGSASALREQFRTNQAAVDSELALLAANRPGVNGYVANALFQNEHPSSAQLASVIKVSRLDGPTLADARLLIDHALDAERDGLRGRAYVDLGGPHPDGDRWLNDVVRQIDALGFELSVDREPGTFDAGVRADAPALYFGWYAPDLNGPFALPGFRFPPGAVALHIHSFSAHTVRSGASGWSGPLVAHGVAATVGNVFEPYLQLTHRPDLLLRALARGESFGDAAAYACPGIGWQCIAIGDPLYRPFGRPLDQQSTESGSNNSEYVNLRRARLLQRDKKTAESFALLRAAFKTHPNLAAALALAAQYDPAKDENDAIRSLLQRTAVNEILRPDQWGLAHAVVVMLGSHGGRDSASRLLSNLLGADLPAALRAQWSLELDAADRPSATGGSGQPETEKR